MTRRGNKTPSSVTFVFHLIALSEQWQHLDMYAQEEYKIAAETEDAMRVMQDKIADIDEPSSERMQFRTKPHIKRAIQKAAALSGMDDTTFAMNAAYSKALETIEQHENFVLRQEFQDAFFAALDNPPPPTTALRAAMAHHDKTIIST